MLRQNKDSVENICLNNNAFWQTHLRSWYGHRCTSYPNKCECALIVTYIFIQEIFEGQPNMTRVNVFFLLIFSFSPCVEGRQTFFLLNVYAPEKGREIYTTTHEILSYS